MSWGHLHINLRRLGILEDLVSPAVGLSAPLEQGRISFFTESVLDIRNLERV